MGRGIGRQERGEKGKAGGDGKEGERWKGREAKGWFTPPYSKS